MCSDTDPDTGSEGERKKRRGVLGTKFAMYALRVAFMKGEGQRVGSKFTIGAETLVVGGHTVSANKSYVKCYAGSATGGAIGQGEVSLVIPKARTGCQVGTWTHSESSAENAKIVSNRASTRGQETLWLTMRQLRTKKWVVAMVYGGYPRVKKLVGNMEGLIWLTTQALALGGIVICFQ